MKSIVHASAIAAALLIASGAHAAEINALITTAMKAAIDELTPSLERASGHTLRVAYGPSGGLARRFNAGEPADFIAVDSNVLEELIKQGKVLPGRTDIARTGIGIAVRKGAPKPDVSSPEALKRALIAAKSIGHTAPAGGGVTAMHVLKMFEKLGVAAKTKLAAGGPSGRVSVLVSSGEAELGLQLVSELMSNPDVEVVGLLPADLQLIAIIAAGISAGAKQPEAKGVDRPPGRARGAAGLQVQGSGALSLRGARDRYVTWPRTRPSWTVPPISRSRP
jgi:molybdate transport system substrate-binding protein